MEFEWDPAKRLANLAKHGLDFEDVVAFDWVGAVVQVDSRKDYGEVRYRTWGLYAGRMYSVAFTRKGKTIRIISFRKANPTEVKRYGP